jgi:hypothetical protein
MALVKLDLEGNEIRALRGMERHLELRKIANIILECNPGIAHELLGVSVDELIHSYDELLHK